MSILKMREKKLKELLLKGNSIKILQKPPDRMERGFLLGIFYPRNGLSI